RIARETAKHGDYGQHETMPAIQKAAPEQVNSNKRPACVPDCSTDARPLATRAHGPRSIGRIPVHFGQGAIKIRIGVMQQVRLQCTYTTVGDDFLVYRRIGETSTTAAEQPYHVVW